MVGHIKELLGRLEFHTGVGQFVFISRVGSYWAAIVHVVAFSLPERKSLMVANFKGRTKEPMALKTFFMPLEYFPQK